MFSSTLAQTWYHCYLAEVRIESMCKTCFSRCLPPVPMLLSHCPLRISVFLFLLLIFHAISASFWSSWQLAMVWPRRRGQGRQAPSLLPHHATGWPLYWLCSATSWPGRKVRIQAVTFSTKTVPFRTHIPVPNGTVSVLNLNARSQEIIALEPCRDGIVPFQNNHIVRSFLCKKTVRDSDGDEASVYIICRLLHDWRSEWCDSLPVNTCSLSDISDPGSIGISSEDNDTVCQMKND